MATYINVDDEEQAASAIVEGLQRMLTAEREAHGAVKETCARLKRQLEERLHAQALREEQARVEAEQLLQQRQRLLQQREEHSCFRAAAAATAAVRARTESGLNDGQRRCKSQRPKRRWTRW